MRHRFLFAVALLPLFACTHSIDNGELAEPAEPAAPAPSAGATSSPGSPDSSARSPPAGENETRGSGTSSESSGSSAAGSGTSSPSPPSPVKKRAFVTSSSFKGDLIKAAETAATGAAAADALCQAAADAAVLGGTYQALIETPTEQATARLDGAGPWVTTTGVLVFNNKANLTTSPLAKFNVNEKGGLVFEHYENGSLTGGSAWTGIGDAPAPNDPNASSAYCNSWSAAGTGIATVGSIGVSNQTWRASGKQACDSPAHLYCFEI